MSRKAVTYVELDMPYCSLSWGVAPCTASVLPKCCNTLKTCDDTANYTEFTVTLRFAMPADYLPRDIDCIPCVLGVPEHTPGKVSLGEDLGERAVLRVRLKDKPTSDTALGLDKYYAERAYNPFKQGTLFSKFRARQPFLRGRALRWKQGFVGQDLADFETRHFVVDSFDGPDQDGVFTLIAKDVLKLLDGDRAQAPAMSSGYLSADIADGDVTASLLPAGIGNSDYPASDYVCVGGNEIVKYARDTAGTVDANCKLYLKFSEADSATATVDSSPSGLTVTRSGTPFVAAGERCFPEFFGQSSFFDGSGDNWNVPDAATWAFGGTGNLTLEAIVKPKSSLSADRVIMGQGSSSSVRYRFYVDTNGALRFEVLNSGTLLSMASANSLIVLETGYHVAVERFGNLWTLYINGAIVQTATASITIPDIAAPFRVGGGESGNNGWLGLIANVRVSNVARYGGVAFTPPVAAYQSSGDVLNLLRAQLGSSASSHQAQDRVQKLLRYSGAKASAIIRDLEVNYANVPSSYIDLAAWTDEDDTYLNKAFTAIICEPTPVKQLVEELIKQAQIVHWVDDTAPALRFQVLRPVSPAADVIDASRRTINSFEIADQPEKRRSRVQIYYGLKDPTKGIEDLDNYRSNEVVIDAEAEAQYGNIVSETIKSRWIPQFGRSTARAAANKVLARYRDAPRRMSHEVMRLDESEVPKLASGYQLAAWQLQDEYGAPKNAGIQVTRLMAGPASIKVEAEEILGVVVPDDPNHHIITIDGDTYDFDMRAVHDSLFGAPVNGNIITVKVLTGVRVGSTSSSIPAFKVGSWGAFTVTLNLDLKGDIEGKGGEAGLGANVTANGSGVTGYTHAEDGQAGGTALDATGHAIKVGGNGRVRGGGGGGGGGGAAAKASSTKYGGPGGGGAGFVEGEAAPAQGSIAAGNPGTYDAGGAGKQGSSGIYGANGGNGGGPGVAGSNGNGATPILFPENEFGLGGAAGKAVNGNSNVTETGTVTFTGPRV